MKMRRPAARRSLTAALGVVLVLVLSGCLDLKGELSIDSDGRISGTQRVEIKKEVGAGLGMTNLDAFKMMLESGGAGGMLGGATPDTSDADDSCPGGFSFEETDTAFAAVCAFENQEPDSSDNDMFSITRVGDNLELTFSNDASSEDAAAMAMMGMSAMGTIDMTFNLPGAIQGITGTTADKVTQVDGDTVRIQGPLLEAYDIKVVSSATGGSNPGAGAGAGGGVGVPTPGGDTGGTDTGGTDTGGTDTGSTDNGTTGSDVAQTSDDGGTNAGLIVAAVIVILVLLAVIGFLVLRGRGKSKGDQAQPAYAGAPAGAAPAQAQQQWDPQAQQAQPQQPTQAIPTQPQQAPEATAPQAQQSAAPGWYPVPGDPSGQPRYWDGTTWSDPQQ